MKCKNVKKFRYCIVKPFKYTNDKIASKCQHLIGEKVIIVDTCDQREAVYVKENLKDYPFYQIHHKDLKRIK